MKFLHAVSLAALSTFVAANPLRVTVIIDDEPDASPALTATHPIEWSNCGDSWDIFQLKNVTITPNPPVSGKTYKVAFHGSLSEDVEDGAYYDFTTKLGIVKIKQETHQLCTDDYLDVECPQKKGKDVVWESKDIMMKKEVPPGLFTLAFNGFTANDESLFCIRAKADMRPSRPAVTSHRVEVDNVAFRVQA